MSLKVTSLPVTCLELNVVELILKSRIVDLNLKVTSLSGWSVQMSQPQSSLAHSCVSWADPPGIKKREKMAKASIYKHFN